MSKKSNRRRSRRRVRRRTMRGGAHVFRPGTLVRLSQKGKNEILDGYGPPEAGGVDAAFARQRANRWAAEVEGWRGRVADPPITPLNELRVLTPAQQRARTKGFGPTRTTPAGHTIHQYIRAGPPSIKVIPLDHLDHQMPTNYWTHMLDPAHAQGYPFVHNWVGPQDYFIPAGTRTVHPSIWKMQREARQLRRHPLASDPNFSVAGRAANRTRATRAMAALPEGARVTNGCNRRNSCCAPRRNEERPRPAVGRDSGLGLGKPPPRGRWKPLRHRLALPPVSVLAQPRLGHRGIC